MHIREHNENAKILDFVICAHGSKLIIIPFNCSCQAVTNLGLSLVSVISGIIIEHAGGYYILGLFFLSSLTSTFDRDKKNRCYLHVCSIFEFALILISIFKYVCYQRWPLSTVVLVLILRKSKYETQWVII